MSLAGPSRELNQGRQPGSHLDADVSSSSSEELTSSGSHRQGRRRTYKKRTRPSSLGFHPNSQSQSPPPRGGVTGKGKGPAASGRASKSQGLTAQGRTQELTKTKVHSNKEGPMVSLSGPLQGTSEAETTPSSDSESSGSSDLMGQPAKRYRADHDSASESRMNSTLPWFKPGSLVKSKEGTFQVPSDIKEYLDKYMKRCLTKEEREALFKQHPRPNLDSCLPPKVDKYMSEHLGKRFPRERDTELSKIQTAILASIRPLTLAWQHLVEAKLEDNQSMVVPATEVLTLIQQTICMIGNASEFTSQMRRAQILGEIDSSWSKFSSESFVSATGTLFGEKFQRSLGKRVENEVALAKAVSITKRSKKDKDVSSTRKDRHRNDQFFRRGPPAKYGSRQGKSSLHPYDSYQQPRQTDYRKGRQMFGTQRQGQRPRFHEPTLPAGPKTQQKKSWTS